MRTVAALFVRSDSIYKTMADVDCWDLERDAMTWPGGAPVVAHPPCRLWGELSHMSTAPESEKETGRFSVRVIQRYGGVLEHPKRSKLWADMGLPRPGQRIGIGFTLPVLQMWWGHKAEKATWLYIVGVEPHELPEIPFVMGEATHKVTNGGSPWHRKAKDRDFRPELSKADRERTPPAFAEWLVETARRCRI